MRLALALSITVAVMAGACGAGSDAARDTATEACRAFVDPTAAERVVSERFKAGQQEQLSEDESEAAGEALSARMGVARDKAKAASLEDPKWNALAGAMADQHAFAIEGDQNRALVANTGMREVIRPQCSELLSGK